MSRLVLCVALLAALGAGCGHGSESEQQAAAAVTAGTAVAVEQPFAQAVNAIGTVNPRPGRFAELSAPGPTRVARIFVAPGQPAAEGDSLVGFERAPFDASARSAAAAPVSAEPAYSPGARLVPGGGS